MVENKEDSKKKTKNFILCYTLSCQKISASIRLTVAMAESNLRNLRSQLLAIIQKGGDDGISLIGLLQNIYNGFCIYLNFNGLEFLVNTDD